MKYGVTLPNHRVFIKGSTYFPALAWAQKYESNGTYNYEAHDDYNNIGISWNFSKKEDAVIFALKFKK